MDESTLPAVACFVVIILREILNVLKERKNGRGPTPQAIKELIEAQGRKMEKIEDVCGEVKDLQKSHHAVVGQCPKALEKIVEACQKISIHQEMIAELLKEFRSGGFQKQA